ncbi:MAG: XdhC family protein [Bryobacteraceae bacterium]
MDEFDAILQMWRSLEGSDRNAVLATVVHVTGSAYRRPGARMLLVPGGRRVGSISGGCLEGEVSKRAWWFTGDGKPVVRVYDTSSDEEAVWEFGLGCNGVVHVLLERMQSPAALEAIEFLAARQSTRSAAAVATVIRAADGFAVGDRLLLDGTSSPAGALAGSSIEDALSEQSADVLRSRESRLVHLGELQVFIEWFGPPQSLLIFGAGHDAVPLTSIAAELGWEVTVADGRPAYVCLERFPGARHAVLLRPDSLLDGIAIDPDTAVVMMTHNYPLDMRLLPRIIAARPRYLGLLGPRVRTERLFAELGLPLASWVHGPIGLDIGSNTPSAIALSIAAEIQAALSRRPGGMLKLRTGSIHSPVLEQGTPVPFSGSVRPAYCESAVNVA